MMDDVREHHEEGHGDAKVAAELQRKTSLLICMVMPPSGVCCLVVLCGFGRPEACNQGKDQHGGQHLKGRLP